MKSTFNVFLLLGLLVLSKASLDAESKSNDVLLKVDEDKTIDLDADDIDGSGSDELALDDDDYYYDEDDDYDDDYEDESSGSDDEDEEEEEEELIVDEPEEEDDLHFEDDTAKDIKNNNILYEYYNEIYEEDYDDDDDVVEETPKVVRPPHPPPVQKFPPQSVLNSSNLLLMVASGLASFVIFSLAFVLCCLRQRSGKSKGDNLPFVIDSAFHHRGCGQPSSSIVKNYQRVPTSTKEFLDSNCGLENPAHILKTSGQSSFDSEKPLLP